MVSRERRDKAAMVSLEESIYEAARNYAYRNELSLSGYIRSVIVHDLIERGLITEDDVKRLAAGA